MKIFKTLLLIVLGLTVLGWLGNADFADAQFEHQLYCHHVFGENPIWPDYKNIGPEACDAE